MRRTDALGYDRHLCRRRRLLFPECALAVLGQPGNDPSRVALHDPQFHVDRSKFSGDVGFETVDVRRVVTDRFDAAAAVRALDERFPGAFRPDIE